LVNGQVRAEADGQRVAIPLRNFLIVTDCPAEWRRHDLYLLGDEEVAFYVGQSYNAFERVWEHLRGGFKGRSVVGRFVLSNWPRAMGFIVELLHSGSPRFDPAGNTPEAAERYLIEQLRPCFNEALNDRPTPLPARYARPDAKVRRPRSLKQMMREAEYAIRSENSGRPWE